MKVGTRVKVDGRKGTLTSLLEKGLDHWGKRMVRFDDDPKYEQLVSREKVKPL